MPNARDIAVNIQQSNDSFWDDLMGSKNDQLRNTMNSGIAGNAPDGDVVARKTRNPQTIEEIRSEKEAISIQNAESKAGYEVRATEWENEKNTKIAVSAVIAYFIFK